MSDNRFSNFLETWRAQLPAKFAPKVVDEFVRQHYDGLAAKFRDRILLARNAKLNEPEPTRVAEVVYEEPPPDEASPGAREAANLMAMQIAAATKPADMTPAQRQAVLRYSGWGGLSIDRFKGKFPEGLEPDSFALIHEYYTPTIVTESIARRICPLLPTLSGMNGRINAIEPSVGIGRLVRALSSPGCPAGDNISWITVELAKESSLIWKALRPDVKHYEMSFEKFIAQHGAQVHGRTNLIISNPPYGERGEFALDDPDKKYRKEKKAYLYFMRRGLDLLAPGGLGVFLIPAAFMSGPSHKALRGELLKRYHLSAAFRLPSSYPNAQGNAGKKLIPGADVVIDVIFWRARGGVLGEVDEADRFIADGRYFAENPSHLLGREETPFEESGGKFNRYRVIGNFTGLPPLEERPLCSACTLKNLPSVPDPEPKEAPVDDNLSEPLQAAIALGNRVAGYLALRAADEGEQLVQLWPELHGALKDLQQSSHLLEDGGNPWRWTALVKLAQQRRVRGAEELLNAFDKSGRIVPALAEKPHAEPKYKGSPDDILGQANELFRQRRSLRTSDLMDFHRKVGGQIKQEDAVRTLLAAEWNLDGEKWDELLPLDAYTSGLELWERHDRAKKHADQGEEQGRVQVRRLLAAIKPAVFEDITDVSPQHGFVPLELASKFVSETLNRNIGPVEFEREGGLVRIKGRRYADDTSAGAAPNTLAFLGWLNHDNVLFEPYREFRDDGSGERYTIAQQRVRSARQWDEEFKRWLAGDETRRRRYTNAYNRANRGRVVPAYPAEPLDIARWGAASPQLRDHQVRGARRVLENRGGLVAFDVGVGKTYTAIAIIARARQEGWVRRPVVVVPSSLTWKWHDDIRCTLPDYRVEVIGSNRVRIQRGPRKGQLTSETDTPQQRAAKWIKFQNGELDVVVLSYDALDRTPISEEKVKQHAEKVAAIERTVALARRNAQKKKQSKLTEREKALLDHGVMAFVRERLALSKNEKPDPGIRWDELGVDMIVVDEAQNFKNLYMPQPREGGIPKFMGAAGKGSKRAWQLEFRCALVRQNTGGAGVVLLSATPAKNSPLEFYNILQYVDPQAFYASGIYDPEQFIDRFLTISMRDVLDMSFNVTERSAVTGFQNLDDLRTILLSYGEFRTAEEVKLKLPCPVVQRVTVKMDDEQEAKYTELVSEIEDMIEEGKGGTGMLGMLARLSLIAVHGQLDEGYTFDTAIEGGLARKKVSEASAFHYQNRGWTLAGIAKKEDDDEEEDDDEPMVFVEKKLPKPDYNSPKFTECAKRVVAAKNCGHIIFSEATATHQWIREVLVKAGVPRERIAIMNAEVTKPAQRVKIAREFNGLNSEPLPAGTCASGASVEVEPKYDVVIANSVAYEGIDLQVRTCAIHHIDMPWTPSDLQQRNGRGVRQGNKLSVLHIYYYFSDGSSDGYRFSLVDGKANWLRELLASQVRDTNNPAAQQKMSPNDILLMISRDKERTQRLLDERKKAAEAEVKKKKSEEATRILRSAAGRFREARETRDPERAAVLRSEGESRLAELARVDVDAWPWAPWMYAVRNTDMLVNVAGAPVYDGLRVFRPRAGFPGEFEHLEFGRIVPGEEGPRIGLRGSGSGRWELRDPDKIGLTPEMYPQEGAPPWPADDDRRTEVAIDNLIREQFKYTGGRFEFLGWKAASDAFIDHWWPRFAKPIAEGMSRSYYTKSASPLIVDDKLVLATKEELPDGMLLPPSDAGWKQYLALAPATEYSFTELRDVGKLWWDKSLPQDLLSKGRPKIPKTWVDAIQKELAQNYSEQVEEKDRRALATKIADVIHTAAKQGRGSEDELTEDLMFLAERFGRAYAPRKFARLGEELLGQVKIEAEPEHGQLQKLVEAAGDRISFVHVKGEPMPSRDRDQIEAEWMKKIRKHLRTYESHYGDDEDAPDFGLIASDIARHAMEAAQAGEDHDALVARFRWLEQELGNTYAPRDFAHFVEDLIDPGVELGHGIKLKGFGPKSESLHRARKAERPRSQARTRSTLEIGTAEEQREHRWADRATARRIAADHLRERPDFYDRSERLPAPALEISLAAVDHLVETALTDPALSGIADQRVQMQLRQIEPATLFAYPFNPTAADPGKRYALALRLTDGRVFMNSEALDWKSLEDRPVMVLAQGLANGKVCKLVGALAAHNVTATAETLPRRRRLVERMPTDELTAIRQALKDPELYNTIWHTTQGTVDAEELQALGFRPGMSPAEARQLYLDNYPILASIETVLSQLHDRKLAPLRKLTSATEIQPGSVFIMRGPRGYFVLAARLGDGRLLMIDDDGSVISFIDEAGVVLDTRPWAPDALVDDQVMLLAYGKDNAAISDILGVPLDITDDEESYAVSRDGAKVYDAGWTNARSLLDHMAPGRETMGQLAEALENADLAVRMDSEGVCDDRAETTSPEVWLSPPRTDPVFAVLRGDRKIVCKVADILRDLGFPIRLLDRPTHSRLQIERRGPATEVVKEIEEGLRMHKPLPPKAMRMWEHVFESQRDRGLPKDRAAASAWSQVKQHYTKRADGRWVKAKERALHSPAQARKAR